MKKALFARGLAVLCMMVVFTVPAAVRAEDFFARDSYRIDPVVCPFKGTIDYEPGDLECGLLQVPENREDPASRFIELHFVKLNSRWGRGDDDERLQDSEASGLAPGTREDPVIYLTGGPGATVDYYVTRFLNHGLLDHRDMYILEQRGVGYSDDFCRFYRARTPALADAETFEKHIESELIRIRNCAANARAAGIDLAGYKTLENARDVKALRRALGFEKWNVWGISYGSTLGQAYLKEDPDGIRAVVLDAISPLDIRAADSSWRIVHWYDRDLKKLQQICDRQPDCARLYPDIGGRLRDAVGSVIASPIELRVKDTEKFPSGLARLFEDTVAFLPFTLLYEQDNYPGLPGLIYAWADAVERRDETLLRAIAVAGDDDFSGFSEGMYNAILCSDGHAEAFVGALRRDIDAYPLLGAASGTVAAAERRAILCAETGMPERPAAQYAPVRTELPTLIIEGEMDPITPPPNAKAILPGFANGTYVEFPFAGHGPSRSVECAGAMLNKFYDNPRAEPDLSCVDEMEEPQMYAPLYTSSVVPRLLTLFVEDRERLVLPAASAGISVLISLVAFLTLSFAPLVRAMEGRRALNAGGARIGAWLAATMSVASVAVLGAAAFLTHEQSEMLPLFGFVPWARWGAWLGLAAGLLGVLTLVAVARLRRTQSPQRSALLGFALSGAAALSLSIFLTTWGLSPF
jgi:pimeloyl-ACP methyl ester carboxylesterase